MLIAQSDRRRRVALVRSWLLLAASVLLAAFTASQIRLFLQSTGSEAPWLRLFFGQLLWWLLWAALLPAVTALSRRFPFERGWHPMRAILHLVLGAAVALTHTLARVALLPLVLGRWDLRWEHEIVFGFSTYFHWNVVLYFLIVASEHAWRNHKRARERELETSRLQTRLARAELEALRRQIQPHFLFNALQSIAELVHESPEKAETVILELGELLRWTLSHEDAMEVTLRQELDFTERYLQIEQVRFEERLRVVWNIEPDTFEARVPQLLLQPLVDNAIRHGLGSRVEGGTLVITARREDGSLELTVTDDGIGLRGDTPWGVGLENARERLERFYGSEQHLEVAPRSGGGARARVRIPFHPVRVTT
jgi:two-component system LytT family sensor kinase